MGAMADALYSIFTERQVTDDDVIKASDKIGYFKDKMTDKKIKDVIDSCTPYWEARSKKEFDLSSNKEIIYLDSKTRNAVISCVNSLTNNKQVQDLLHPSGILEDPISENEQAILLDVEAECPNGKKFIIRLKSKVDNYTIDKETNTLVVNDIKTIGKIVSEMESNIQKFHYSREFGMYCYLMKLVSEKFYGLTNPKIQANYLIVSTIPNYYSKVRPVSYAELKHGFNEFSILLRYVAYLIGYKNYSLGEQTSKFKF